MLHISDYVHNKEFRDNYLSKYTHDFSKIWFIYCMNRTDTLDPALLSRLDIVEVKPYDTKDKMIILQNYMLPRALDNVRISRDSVKINDKAANKLVMATKSDCGMRTIEKAIKSLVGKINMYKSIVLKYGSVGNISLPYTIMNFKFPLLINPKILVNLTKDIVSY